MAFQEVFPEEAEPLIHQHKSAFMKHKEMIDKLGPILDGEGAYPKSANTESANKKSLRKERLTEKPKQEIHGYLSPKTGSRRDDAPKSQNRMSKQNKYLSEERVKSDKGTANSSNKASMSTGFTNLKARNYNDNKIPKETYDSKHLKPPTNNNSESGGTAGRTLSATAARPRTQYAPKNGLMEKQKKLAHEDPNLIELDEKCQDISEIELDPEDNKEETFCPQPYQGYKMASKVSPEEEIAELIGKAESTNWIDRVNAFEQLANYISNKASSLPNVSTFCKIVNLHFDHLDDQHFKVILVVHKSFGKLVHSFGETLEPYLSEIIPRLLVNLSDKREKVNSSANILLNLLIQRYGGDKLMKYFVSVLDIKEDVIVIEAALEVLSHQLIKCTYDYFKEKSNIKKIIKRIGRVVYEYSGNKTITMPALGTLLALRDLDTNRTIKAITNLTDKQIEIIKSLSDSYAPDLASNLNSQGSSDYGQIGSNSINNYPIKEKKFPSNNGSDFHTNNFDATPFFHEYDQVMAEEEPQNTNHGNHLNEVTNLGFPEDKSVYTNEDMDVIVDNIKTNVDSRIDCMSHLQRFIQLCSKDSPSQRTAVKNRKIWKEYSFNIMDALYD